MPVGELSVLVSTVASSWIVVGLEEVVSTAGFWGLSTRTWRLDADPNQTLLPPGRGYIENICNGL